MNGDQLESFLDDPAAYLGDNALRIFPPAMSLTGADVRQVLVPHVGEFECTVLSAARNAPPLTLSMASDARTLEVGPNDPGRQSQRKTAFYLPWATNKVYAMRLGEVEGVDLFFTAEVNGCCVLIAGPDTSPCVVHANLSTDDLEDFDITSVPFAQAGAALRKHQLKIYDRNYWALMGRLQALNVIPDDAQVTLFDPSTYFAHDGNKARLMGVKKDGRWQFFTNTETAATTGMPPRKVHLSARLL